MMGKGRRERRRERGAEWEGGLGEKGGRGGKSAVKEHVREREREARVHREAGGRDKVA